MKTLGSKWFKILVALCLTIGIVRAIIFALTGVIFIDVFVELLTLQPVGFFNPIGLEAFLWLFLIYLLQAVLATALIAVIVIGLSQAENLYRQGKHRGDSNSKDKTAKIS